VSAATQNWSGRRATARLTFGRFSDGGRVSQLPTFPFSRSTRARARKNEALTPNSDESPTAIAGRAARRFRDERELAGSCDWRDAEVREQPVPTDASTAAVAVGFRGERSRCPSERRHARSAARAKLKRSQPVPPRFGYGYRRLTCRDEPITPEAAMTVILNDLLGREMFPDGYEQGIGGRHYRYHYESTGAPRRETAGRIANHRLAGAGAAVGGHRTAARR